MRRLPGTICAAGILLVSGMFFYGAWERRWIADDGLIVLRTVRNLLAGNGPVFNKGERVETNTSAAWTYVIWFFSWISQARLEYVALTVALTGSILAVVLAMLGARRLYRSRTAADAVRGGVRGGMTVLLPAGILVYIALPPARDFATSGLESGLIIFWIGLVWWMLIRWATTERPGAASVLTLCFVAGLCWLVRPETVIVGALVLLMLFCSRQTWKMRVAMVAVGGAVPIGYQIWRMGYYALPYPNTAVAKEASGAKWHQGFIYLFNLVSPYWMWLPLALLLVGVLLARPWRCTARWPGSPARRGPVGPRAEQISRVARLQAWLHTPAAVVTVMLAAACVWLVYVLRVGGDFMHGRVLLPVVFLFILPVAMVPLRIPSREQWRERGPVLAFASSSVLLLGVGIWSIFVANAPGQPDPGTITRDGIVDERQFYVINSGHAHPLTAQDYLDYPRMRAMVSTINSTPDGGLLLDNGTLNSWAVVPPWGPIEPGGDGHTVYFLNLGMTSMNVGLDVRVIDQEGLAYPLAAHTPRMEHGRIGHDKDLPPDWVVADLGLADVHPWLPPYMDENWVQNAEVALTCPDTQDLLASYRSKLTLRRFVHNVTHAFEYAKYRIDPVPAYEIQRCHLTPPVPRHPA
ncbi:hypothetical protein G4X40_09845 [Rhodococcus sp. D2-41]|uniref:flagellar motor control protein ZomB n=1 Tax=Speluncibacter jeojiensis TaxID=2710754 RepID=UPI00240EC5E2|nr:flagellar motor control protein ZomB [Rhodococcus sp. D2-41]MDG3010448.1 hypothetical protein [Rhodococcus sp. D2-41]